MGGDRPSALESTGRRARRAPSRVLGLLSNLVLVGAIAAVLAGGAYWLAARPDPPPIVIKIPTPTPPPPVVVDVRGAVAVPGVYTLPSNARIEDALSAAGGAAPDADLGALSQAAPVRDGDVLVIPTSAAPVPTAALASESQGGTSTAASTRVPAPEGGLVDLNRASVQELETLPGIGPTRAQAIVQWRQQHGAFQTPEDLLQISGIGPQTLANIRPKIVLP